jgi:hypothetical protein
MNEMIYDQNKEEPLTYEIPDEVLEIAACTNCTGKLHPVDMHGCVFLPRRLAGTPQSWRGQPNFA